jgi:transcriptional regulator with XRE-family HTH domain
MGERHERLTAARKRAGYPSARQAAEKNGWNKSTYASPENGQTPLPVEEAHKYARAFKVSPAWLLTAEGQMTPAKQPVPHPKKLRDAKNRIADALERFPPDTAKLNQLLDFMEFIAKR